MDDLKVARKLLRIHQSANDRKVSCTLSFKKLKSLLKVTKCYYTGIELNFIEGHDNQLTIDRVDNDLGYQDDNVVVCSKRINCLKDNLTVQEIKYIHKGLKRKGFIK